MHYLYSKYLENISWNSLSLLSISLPILSSIILSSFTSPAYGFQIDFSDPDGNLTNSETDNLGATMTYRNAITDDLTNLDLVVQVVDSYQPDPDKVNNNGSISQDIGRVNIASSSSTRFKFSIVEPVSGTPYTISTIDFSLIDVDGNDSSNGAKEKAILYSPADYTLVEGTPYLNDNNLGDRVEITATNNSVSNPKSSTMPRISSTEDPINALTTEQEQHAINFKFNNVSEFELSYEVIGGNKSRNFFFTGEVFFDETPSTTSFEPVPLEFSPSLGLLLSGGSLLGIRFLKRRSH